MPKINFTWKQLYSIATNDPEINAHVPLYEMIFARNIRWFIMLRWIAVFILSIVILLSNQFAQSLSRVDISAPSLWYFIIVLLLSVANLTLGGKQAEKALSPIANIWAQIIVDLFCLTWVVHFCGSAGTPAPFLYVLHISLACIFFDLRSSFLVTLIAALMYSGCIAVEYSGILQPASILPINTHAIGWYIAPLAISMDCVFFLVWYITSRLSKIIHFSETMLVKANENCRLAEQERSRQALQMTHQLKSPLDAVESYLQLIEEDIGGAMTPKTKRLMNKILSKLAGMRALILDVLQLSRLDPESERKPGKISNIGRLLYKCIEDMIPKALQKNISVQSKIEDVILECYESQIQVLFANLLSNAINYSHENGTVHVSLIFKADRNEAELVVEDKGIGIDPEKLPRIFEPYFRTKEAALHNANSTGIGLALVSRIAKTHRINISVKSIRNEGSTFTLTIPHASLSANTSRPFPASNQLPVAKNGLRGET